MKIDYLEHEKVNWLYNPDTDELDEINPAPPRPVDYGKPNAHIILWRAGAIVFTAWVISYNLILN